MKYTIWTFQQEKLIKNNMSLGEALVLKTVVDVYASNSPSMHYEVIDGQRYVWFTLKRLLEEIPIIGTTRTLKSLIKKLVEKDFLEKQLIYKKSGKAGKYQFLAPGSKYHELLEYDTERFDEEESTEEMATKGRNFPYKIETRGKDFPKVEEKVSPKYGKSFPIKDNIHNNNIHNDNTHKQACEEKATSLPASSITNIKLQEVSMLLQGIKIRPAVLLMKAEGDIERIRKAIEYAKKYGKGPGWITACVQDNYDLTYTEKKQAGPKEEARSLDVDEEMQVLKAMFGE